MTEENPKKRKLNEKKFEQADILGNDQVVFRLITKANIKNLAVGENGEKIRKGIKF